MPTIAMQTRDALRRFFALRLNASIFLVPSLAIGLGIGAAAAAD